ncbi:hypothetical protein D3C76_800500 [compost metagenome]
MAHLQHTRVTGGIGNTDRVINPAQGFHRVEQAKKGDVEVAAERFLELALQGKIRLVVLVLVTGQEHGPGIIEKMGLMGRYQPQPMHQCGKRPGRVSTSREAEHEHLVARLVLLGEKTVRTLDIAFEPPAEGQAKDPRRKLLPFEQGFLEAERTDALVIVRQDLLRVRIERPHKAQNVRRLLAEAVVSPIQAYHELPGHVQNLLC